MAEPSNEDLLRAITRMGEGLTQLRADMMVRLDRVQDDVQAIRDDIGVNMASAERVRHAHDGTRAELRDMGDQLAAIWRKVQRLESEVRTLRGEA